METMDLVIVLMISLASISLGILIGLQISEYRKCKMEANNE